MKNGIKYLVAGLVATGLTASASYATISVGWGTASNTYLTDNTGAAGYLNGFAEIGTFASAPTLGSSSLAGFSVFGTATVADGIVSAFSTATAGATFGHTQIYWVMFNAATQGAATQEAIFYESDASNSAWKFPADADVTTTTTIDAQDLFGSSTSGNLTTGGHVVFGSTGTDGSGPYSLLETAPIVPEPSTYLLVGTGLLGLLGLRRRK